MYNSHKTWEQLTCKGRNDKEWVTRLFDPCHHDENNRIALEIIFVEARDFRSRHRTARHACVIHHNARMLRATDGFALSVDRVALLNDRSFGHHQPIALRDQQTKTRSSALIDCRTAVARDD